MKTLIASLAVVLALAGVASANPHAMFRANFSAAVYAPAPLVTYQQPQAIVLPPPPPVVYQPPQAIQLQQAPPVAYYQAPQVQFIQQPPVAYYQAPQAVQFLQSSAYLQTGGVSFFTAPSRGFSRTTTRTFQSFR